MLGKGSNLFGTWACKECNRLDCGTMVDDRNGFDDFFGMLLPFALYLSRLFG